MIHVLRRPAVVADATLFGLALAIRLPLLSASLDEVDAANFVNALAFGYDVPLLRPHPPGYPVYVFLGYVIDRAVGDPLTSLSLLSAVLGALTVVPVHRLLLAFVGRELAIAGALLWIVQPLHWAFSEAALSDVPAAFFAALLAWLCCRAASSSGAFLAACVVASLAIGVRQSTVALLPLLAVPLLARRELDGRVRLRLAVAGAALFAVTTAAWAIPMIAAGSRGFADYAAAVDKQWSTAVATYSWTRVEPPRLWNVIARIERFFYSYFLTTSWTGDDAKTPLTLVLIAPWLFGFALFVVSFRVRSLAHALVGVWIASIAYSVLSIHFLPRYALPQTPAFFIACLMGYAFLRSTLLAHPWRWELLAAVGIACTVILYGIKHQPPIATFEFTPPTGSTRGAILLTAGTGLLIVLRSVYWRLSARATRTAAGTRRRKTNAAAAGSAPPSWTPWLAGFSVALVVFAVQGYRTASIAHFEKSPSHRLVEFVKARYAPERITVCWDNLTHSSFESLMPPVTPTGFWTVRELFAARDAGRTLIVTDKCTWWAELDAALDLREVARFEGRSPLWTKAPSLRLYVAVALP